MTQTLPATGVQLRSLVTAAGDLELSLVAMPVTTPASDEIIVRVDAAPINPSDLGLLVGMADLGAATTSGAGDDLVLRAPIAPKLMPAMAARVGSSLPVGNEGAGVVVAAGDSPAAQALLGRTVALFGGATYAQYRQVREADVLVLAPGTSAEAGASCFVNPLTALSMVEAMRREGHSALVHTAAASNLGQMLNRICLADGVPLVNIVRSAAQAALLRDQGALHICDTSAADFQEKLLEALVATGATIAFDAVGGGRLTSDILTAMEQAIARRASGYNRYGSDVHKQVYQYGMLDLAPVELRRNFGMAWGVGGWLLMPFLAKIGAEASQALRDRVVAELTTTFASHYSHRISLSDVLDPAVLRNCNRRATGEKYLIVPNG